MLTPPRSRFSLWWLIPAGMVLWSGLVLSGLVLGGVLLFFGLYESNEWNKVVLRSKMANAGIPALTYEELTKPPVLDRLASTSPDGKWTVLAQWDKGLTMFRWTLKNETTGAVYPGASGVGYRLSVLWSPKSDYAALTVNEGIQQHLVLLHFSPTKAEFMRRADEANELEHQLYAGDRQLPTGADPSMASYTEELRTAGHRWKTDTDLEYILYEKHFSPGGTENNMARYQLISVAGPVYKLSPRQGKTLFEIDVIVDL